MFRCLVIVKIIKCILVLNLLHTAQRDKLSCDALCFGSMQSARSGLTMLGNVPTSSIHDRKYFSQTIKITLSNIFQELCWLDECLIG